MTSFGDGLAEDVTLECSMGNLAVRGRDAVRARLTTVGGFHDNWVHRFSAYAGDYGMEEYEGMVAGQPVKVTVTTHRNAEGNYGLARDKPPPALRGADVVTPRRRIVHRRVSEALKTRCPQCG
ncbi:hypothetical protein [Streptomyces liangshanensis]|uniref:Uncharacterized protein n=1 Tax=Streptomyces liangshanensis TaxID=2717324 RepID=A0A6G9H6I5_9ACTN|nr:hypothetical protein [Streptomyces liangshanensis]QIQ06054.1 hypothetical protein HA039_30445 [Streptomyces liangshanensis]